MNILNFKQKEMNKAYLAVSLLGKVLKLNIKYHNSSSIDLNKKETEIDLILPKEYKSVDKTEIIDLAIKKLYL